MLFQHGGDKVRGAVVTTNQDLYLPHPCSSLQCIVELTRINLPLNCLLEFSLILYKQVNGKNSWDYLYCYYTENN